jgi:hypothetical protein
MTADLWRILGEIPSYGIGELYATRIPAGNVFSL